MDNTPTFSGLGSPSLIKVPVLINIVPPRNHVQITVAPIQLNTTPVQINVAPVQINVVPAQQIQMHETPTMARWNLAPLYKQEMRGGMMVWQVGFDGVDHLEMTHGFVDNVRTDRTQVELNSTGRTMQQQALLEARQRYQLKQRNGYQLPGSSTPPMVKGMKGQEYTEKSILSWPVYTQPKLDGIRMLCQHSGYQNADNNPANEVKMMSFGNKPYTHLTHIATALQKFFTYLPRHATLDGEMYRHDMTFNSLASAVRTVKHVHPDLHKIQYHIFDVCYTGTDGPPTLEQRTNLLINAFRSYIQDRSPTANPDDVSVYPTEFVIVPTRIAHNHAEIHSLHDIYVQQGYEGIMVKKCANNTTAASLGREKKIFDQSLYKPGKSIHILKLKNFRDEEATVIGIEEGSGTERGLASLVVRDIRGNVFVTRPRGSFDQRAQWMTNPSQVIGRQYTIRYQDLSEYGVPRFPIGVEFRDYE